MSTEKPKGYWYCSDLKMVKGDDLIINQTWTTTAGAAVDISAWTFAFEANEVADGGAGNIVIADGSMTKSDSGSGVVDKLTIQITDTLSAATNEGRHDYDIKVTVDGNKTTFARGTLTILPSEQD